jgi:hypothetical protein
MDKDAFHLALVNALIDVMPMNQKVRTVKLIEQIKAVLDSCHDLDARAAAISLIAAENIISMTTPNQPH